MAKDLNEALHEASKMKYCRLCDQTPLRPGCRWCDKCDEEKRTRWGEIQRFEGSCGTFDPWGETVLTCGSGRTVRVSYRYGKKVCEIEVPGGIVFRARFLPDGYRFVTGSQFGSIHVWDSRSGDQIRRIGSGLHAFDISPDGRLAVLGDEDTRASIWNVESGRRIQKLGGWFSGKHRHLIDRVLFSPSGDRVFVFDSDSIPRVWDTQTGQQLPAPEPAFNRTVAFSSDGRQALTWADREMHLWDVSTWRVSRKWRADDYCCIIAFSPDGRHILSGGGDLSYWDLKSGRFLRRFGWPSKEGQLNTLEFSPDGTFFVVGHSDGLVRLLMQPNAEQITHG